MRRSVVFLAASFAGLLALVGCGAGDPTATPQPVGTPTAGLLEGQVPVDSIEIKVLETKPVQVQVDVKGNLPDPCTKINSISQSRDRNTFNVTIATIREAGAACIQVITPFEQPVTLDVAGLPAGVYTVVVNGVSDTFELTADNVAR